MTSFQQVVFKLEQFWHNQGCVIHHGHGIEVGAATFNPATFFRCLGPEPYSAAYIEPCRRPTDGRYGENPNRVQQFFQYQVIIKPSPLNILDLYIQSLEAIGFPLDKHDIRFVQDDWESPTLGAWGLGWEIWIDGMEVTQFTYFQSVGGLELHPITAEISYGIERLCMYLQKVDNIFDINWGGGLSYGDIFLRNEIEVSKYNFEKASTEMWLKHFTDFQAEAKRLLSENLPIPAYDFVMKASHAFNILDARGVISVTERTGYISAIRELAASVAKQYVSSRKEQGFPLLKKEKKKEAEKKVPSLSKKLAEPKPNQKESFLLEIGSEELPTTFIPIGLAYLEKGIYQLLTKAKISFSEISIYGTPRRLAILVHDLALLKPEEIEEKKGPSIAKAFDEKGALTKAGEGFLRNKNFDAPSLSDVQKGKIPGLDIRDDYLFAKVVSPATPTAQILQEALPKLVEKIEFPKKMRWSDLSVTYARPVQWIVSLFGKDIVPFIFGNILAGNKSCGHRQLSPKPFSIPKASEYTETLKKHSVLADIEDRKNSILEQLEKITKGKKIKILAQERVLREVVQLSEMPSVAIAPFHKRFLKAPKELIISEMVDHQKYFPVGESNGKLSSQFVVVADIPATKQILEGNQKVLSARLSDGVFMYEEDLKMGLEEMVNRLKQITFQKDLGSVFEKVERIEKHATLIQKTLGSKNEKNIKRAAHLCKADLSSKAVFEFPELQGTMGKYYALAGKEEEEVARAIEEHWEPRGEGRELPKTEAGLIVSLADKIDNLLGCFSVGLSPTSSSDPYALRRQAIGLIKIIIENKYRFSLPTLLEGCATHFPSGNKAKEIIPEVLSFIQNRMRHAFQEYGLKKDEIEATLSFGFHDIYDTFRKVEALHQFRASNQSFNSLLEVYKRAKGQINNFRPQTFNAAIAKEKAEKDLDHYLNQINPQFESTLASSNYQEAYELIAKVQSPLAKLFDEVKILSDDEAIRNNRIALLQRVFTLFEKLLDFSKIQGQS